MPHSVYSCFPSLKLERGCFCHHCHLRSSKNILHGVTNGKVVEKLHIQYCASNIRQLQARNNWKIAETPVIVILFGGHCWRSSAEKLQCCIKLNNHLSDCTGNSISVVAGRKVKDMEARLVGKTECRETLVNANRL